MGLSVRLLGPLEVHDGTAPRRIAAGKERTLLLVLAARAGEVVSTDSIADALWHGEPPPSAAKGLQVLVARLRKVLAAPPAMPLTIEHHGNGYRLMAPAGAVDAGVAEDLLRASRLAVAAGELEQAAAALARAEALWRGPSLAEVRDEPFAIAIAQRLDEMRADITTERLEVDLRRGRHDEVTGALEDACRTHPFRERLWALWMLALYRAGRTAEALRAYQDARSVFEELGLDPGEELRDLEAAILREDPELRRDSASDRALPSGEVSFLLTDIAASTAMWERSPGAMATALVRHDDIVTDIVGRSGGVVVKSKGEGDSTFAVFDDALRAVLAAIDLQRAVLAEPWPAEVDVRVRVAVHTGPAELRGRDYFGPTVNRASRIRSAGHGGQVLLSAATTAMVRDRLPAEVTLRALGERRLRDLREPEHLFQIQHPALPAEFPPLAVLDARPNNLPIQPTSFIGREQLGRTVAELLRGSVWLLTLSGPGGIGKTRLALQTAADMIDDFADGVWFVSLSSVSEPSEVPAAVAAVLGVRAEPGFTAADGVTQHIAERQMLLVLDNFEHLLDAATFVSDLLATCARVKVLATSREWLHVRGEHEVRVDSLDDAAATTLFMDRARAVRMDVDEAAHLPEIERVCRGLDNIPLAIELVAARLRHLDVHEIVRQLTTALDLAADGPRDQPARQRTLRDALAWSVGLLDADEHDAFQALSVFQGPFTPDAASAVIGVDVNAARLALLSLADKSLLARLEGDQFDLLVTVKRYAAELLARHPERVRHVADAHAAYFARVALWWFDEQGGITEDLFEDTHVIDDLPLESLADIRAAAGHAATTASLDAGPLACQLVALLQHVDATEALRWVENPSLGGPGDEWEHWVGVARVAACWAASEHERAAESALAMLESGTPSASGPTFLWNTVGAVRWVQGRLDEAEAALRLALAASEDGGATSTLLAHQNLGLITMSRGDVNAAAELFGAARDLAVAAQRDDMAALSTMRLGSVMLLRGEWRRARDLLEASRPGLPRATKPLATHELVETLVALGEAPVAVDLVRDAIGDMVTEDGPHLVRPVVAASYGRTLGVALRATGDLDAAHTALEGALSLAPVVWLRALVLHELAILHRLRGDLSSAREALTEVSHVTRGSFSRLAWQSAADLARIENESGNPGEAQRLLLAALGQFAPAGHRPAVAELCLTLADVIAGAGDDELAATLLGTARACEANAGIVARSPSESGALAGSCVARLPAAIADELDARGRSLRLAELVDVVTSAVDP